MKKRISIIASVLLAIVLSFSALSGCKLVTLDSEKDYDQIVATVKLNEELPKTDIKKQDLVTGYLNYGYYQYGYSGGKTNAEIYQAIFNDLIDNAIMVQNAMIKFEAGNEPFNDSDIISLNTQKDKWDLERYLSEDEIKEAKYYAIKTINDFIDGYVEEDDEKTAVDNLGIETRNAPTDAKNDDTVDKDAYILAGIKKGSDDVSDKQRKAYLKVMRMLENAKLVNGDIDNVEDSEYYTDTIEAKEKSLLIEKYQKCIEKQARTSVSLDDLKANYVEMYNAQKAQYSASYADFATALSNATASNPVLYSPVSGYGYVYNLLLGADDTEKAMVSELDKDDTAKFSEERAKIFGGITVKDLRSYWLLSGYDFDITTNKFTGDYALLEDSIPFQGTAILKKEKDVEKGTKAEYTITSLKEFSLNEFIDFMDDYVYGESKTSTEAITDKDYLKIVSASSAKEDYDLRIKELLFAFSTDSSATALNTFKGYAISPDGGNFVKEFAKAGNKLLTLGDKSYVIVATEYGYHVMFYSEQLGADVGYPTLVEYLASIGITDVEQAYNDLIKNWNDEETDTTSYLYKFIELYTGKTVSTALLEDQTTAINTYKYDSKYVQKYPQRFADLTK